MQVFSSEIFKIFMKTYFEKKSANDFFQTYEMLLFNRINPFVPNAPLSYLLKK